MDPAEIKDEDSLRAWLEGQPQEISVAIAHRAAMRALPLYFATMRPFDRKVATLPVLRASTTLSIGLRSKKRREMRLAMMAAERTMSDMPSLDRSKSSAGVFALESVQYASSSLFEVTKTKQAVPFLVAKAADAVLFAGAAVNAELGHAHGSVALWTELRADAGSANFADMLARPLWTQVASPVAKNWKKVSDAWTAAGPDWDFWRRWYQAALDGRPLIAGDWNAHWTLLERIALLDPDDSQGLWSDPTALAAEIRRIEEQHRLLAENRRLRAALASLQPASTKQRSSNLPEGMEPLEPETEIQQQLIILWDASTIIDRQLSTQQPDKQELERAAASVLTGRNVLLGMLGTSGAAFCAAVWGRAGEVFFDEWIVGGRLADLAQQLQAFAAGS